MKRTTKRFLVYLISIVMLFLGAVIMLVPFIWMLTTSFKSTSDVFAFPPTLFGKSFVWQNYLSVFDHINFWGMLRNTVIVTVAVVGGQLLTSTMAGFAFTYLNFRGRDMIFKVYLFTIMLPFHVMLIPTFVLMQKLKMLNTLWSLILPCIVSPLGTFLMRQSYLSIPRALAEAAAMDGCTPIGIWWNIYLPLSIPTMTTLGIFTFMGTWNDFLRPLIFLSSNKQMTLTLGLYNLVGNFSTDWEY